MFQKVYDYISENHMIEAGDAIWDGLLSLPQYGGNLKTDSPKASPPQTFHRWLGP